MKTVSLDSQRLEFALSIFGFLCNSFQIVHLISKRRRTLFQTYLLSLSVADILTCIFSFVSTWFYFQRDRRNRELLKYLMCGYNISVFLSTAHICLIAFDRFLTVSRPLRHKLLLKKRSVVRYMHIILWLSVPVLVTGKP